MSPQHPFPLLDLPTELRLKILYHHLHHPYPLPLTSLTTTFPTSLLLTSTQLASETLAVYFTSNTFTLTLRRHNDALLEFLASKERYLVRSLQVRVERWGARDFFVKGFAPVVADMILRGGLRRLEVAVKGASVQVGGERGGGKEGQHWRVLRELLGDPYLESGRLVSLESLETGGCDGDEDWDEWSI